MRDDPSVVGLVARAKGGDERAWEALVERFAPLVWSICRRYGLTDLDAADAGQSVWLRLVEQLPAVREPAALPGWLATTTSRECLRVLRAGRQEQRDMSGDLDVAGDDEPVLVEQELLAAERGAALRDGLSQLPSRCQRLLVLLVHDPPLPYVEISARLGIPVGSIGPSRARCLDKLRRSPALAALIHAEAEAAAGGGEGHDQPWLVE